MTKLKCIYPWFLIGFSFVLLGACLNGKVVPTKVTNHTTTTIESSSTTGTSTLVTPTSPPYGCDIPENWNVPEEYILHIDFRKDAPFPCYADTSLTISPSDKFKIRRNQHGAYLDAESYVEIRGPLIPDGAIWAVLKYPPHNGRDAQVFWDAGSEQGFGYANVVNASRNNKQMGLGFQFEGHYCNVMDMNVPIGAGGIFLETSGGMGKTAYNAYTIEENDYLCMMYRWNLSSEGNDTGQFGYIYLGDSIFGHKNNSNIGKSEARKFQLSHASTDQGCEPGTIEIHGAALDPLIIGKENNSAGTNSALFPMEGEIVAFFLFDEDKVLP